MNFQALRTQSDTQVARLDLIVGAKLFRPSGIDHPALAHDVHVVDKLQSQRSILLDDGWAYYFARSPNRVSLPQGSSGRPAHRSFRGLLGVHSRCGLHTRAVTNS